MMFPYPLYISAVDYKKGGLIEFIYADSAFGSEGMILSRAEIVLLIEDHKQLFFVDETSYSFRLGFTPNKSLNTIPTMTFDRLGHLHSLHDRLGEMSSSKKEQFLRNAKRYLRGVTGNPKPV